MKVWLHSFLTSALDQVEWSALRPSRFPPRKKNLGVPVDQYLWVGPTARLGFQERRILYMQGLYFISQLLFVSSRMYFVGLVGRRMGGLA
jgi:hypothetical protein